MTNPAYDAAAFRAFEIAGWERVAKEYHDGFHGVTAQAVEPLLDAVHARAGVELLDVACGPGYVAAAAARRGARATGLDFSQEMITLAAKLHPSVGFRRGDAQALDFPDRSFDAVTMNFGILHFARPELALAEAWRVLRPSGRIAYSAWALPSQARAFGIVLEAVEAHGRMDAPIPAGPAFFKFADAAASMTALAEAGFGDVEVTTVAISWRLESPDMLIDALSSSTVRTGALLRAQSPDALALIREAVRVSAVPFKKEKGYVFPMPAIVASGRRPEERRKAR